jgi:glycerol-3-phosphate acyltransferase PlsY
METVTTIGMILFAYLFGSVPAALLIGRRVGTDLRKVGSRNPGAANLFREVGKGWGIIGGLFDALKGFIPTFLAKGVLGLSPWVVTLVGIAAVVGHNWPLYFGFNGGRGLATTIGATAYLLPSSFWVAFLVAVFLGFIVAVIPAVKGYAIPVGATAGYGALVITSFLKSEPSFLCSYAVVISVLALIRNVPAFLRLIKRWEESKV